MTQSFSMRKIPIQNDEITTDFQSEITDKIQILELSNLIDEWEKEILFSENGYYYLKGKDVKEKKKEYLKELENFVNQKISKIKFDNGKLQSELQIIKHQKISAIEKQMEEYALQQQNDWEEKVLEETIENIKRRAVLYKNNPEIIIGSYKNGLTVIQMMSEKEKWDKRTVLSKKKEFESDFYLEIIRSFISDKDVRASLYFDEWEEKIQIKEKEKLQTAIKELKQNVTAYNWAKELFSYNLTDEENEKEIKKVEDDEIRVKIRNVLKNLKFDKQKNKKEEENIQNENNWQEITKIMKQEPDKGFLYIDCTLSEESQRNKREYIKTILKEGCIKTDKKKFLEIIKKIYEDRKQFEKEPISDLRNVLSETDYGIVEELKNLNEDEYNLFVSDYEYIEKKLTRGNMNCRKKNSENKNEQNSEEVDLRTDCDDEQSVKCDEEVISTDKIYNFIKLILSTKNIIKYDKNKSLDPDTRNKIIKSALERYI